MTVPLVGVDDDLFVSFPRRIPLGCNAYFIRLDEAEASRLKSANFSENDDYWTVGHRLEILDVPIDRVYEEWNLLEAQFQLVVRRPLTVLGSVLDRRVGDAWRRGGSFDIPEYISWYQDFPAERLQTLRKLREGMNGFNGAPIARAANLYSQSVKALARNERDNSFVLAAIALETLLGYGLTSEITFRLSLRATALDGYSSGVVSRRIKKLYDRRSAVVHSGKHASFTEVTHIQQTLMRFIPAMSALSKSRNGYEQAIEHLDEMAWNRHVNADSVISEKGWWSYVPLEDCFQRNYHGFDDPDRDSRVWLFDY